MGADSRQRLRGLRRDTAASSDSRRVSEPTKVGEFAQELERIRAARSSKRSMLRELNP